MKQYIKLYTILLILASCSAIKNTFISFDDEKNLTRGEIENALLKGNKDKSKIEEPPMPRMSKIISMPNRGILDSDKVISVNVTESVPLVDVLTEVARLSDTNISIDENVKGGIRLNMKDKKLLEVFNAISRTGSLRYSIKDDVVHFEKDTPYDVTYDLGFINIVRSATSSMNVSTSVLTGGSGLSGGSSSSIQSSSNDTLWQDVQSNVTSIIMNQPSFMKDMMQRQQDIMGGVMGMGQQAGGMQQMGQQGMMGGGMGMGQQAGGMQQMGQQGMMGGGMGGQSFVNINKQAGTLVAHANSTCHKMIKDYINKIKQKMTSQVLLEVKIAQVILNKYFERGVDLQYLGKYIGGSPQSSIKTNFQYGTSSASAMTISNNQKFGATDSLASTIALLDQFGTTKILSSPRISTINNQEAIMQIADNQVFFNVAITVTPAVFNNGNMITPAQTSVTSSPKTIPVGIVLVMQPSIDVERGQITLSVRPTLSKMSSTVEDPGVQYSAAQAKVTGISNKVPITSVSEIDTIATLKSGDIMVIGGFTDRQKTKTEKGVPFLSSIPGIGWLFKHTVEKTDMIETVIFIKATIVSQDSGENGVSEYDKYFYKKFIDDPNEFNL
jgi:type II secretory pathway component GspD/PulD (secretin)